VDDRDYGIGAAILADLGVHRVRLITNNPHKYSGLAGYDLELVGRVSSPAAVTPDNVAYLRAKRDRMGHHIELSPPDRVGTAVPRNQTVDATSVGLRARSAGDGA